MKFGFFCNILVIFCLRYQELSTSCYAQSQLLDKTIIPKSVSTEEYEIDLISDSNQNAAEKGINQASASTAPLAQDDEKAYMLLF